MLTGTLRYRPVVLVLWAIVALLNTSPQTETNEAAIETLLIGQLYTVLGQADGEGRCEENNQRNPVLCVRNRQGVERWKKKEVETKQSKH